MVFSYTIGRLLDSSRFGGTGRKLILAAGIAGSAGLMLSVRFSDLILGSVLHAERYHWILPVGLSFYTLQIVAYLADVYKGRTTAETNLARYALFISWFPQIIQGPIPRYSSLRKDLFQGFDITFENITSALRLCVWGFFLKLMIADKAGIFVDAVFQNPEGYAGLFFWIAAALNVIQTYCDFQGCVCISKGVSLLFGIHLPDNFRHPFRSLSSKEFWGRWHISFGIWLRDYIYFPLGGGKKGTVRKYLNLLAVFLVSGLWHGGSFQFLAWGILWVLFRILEDSTESLQDTFFRKLGIPKGSTVYNECKCGILFLLLTLSVVMISARRFADSLMIYRRMFTVWNLWIFPDGSLFRCGLEAKDWNVLLVSILILAFTERANDGRQPCSRLASQAQTVRWLQCFLAVLVIILFGTYGDSFAAQSFIYGGF